MGEVERAMTSPTPRSRAAWWSIAIAPLAWVYGAAVVAARWWRLRVRGARRMAIPVISVGNLTTGGTGKGPFVRWVAEALRADGAAPLIALRGYRADAGGSDEALEHARLLPGVPIAVGADRATEIAAALARDPSIDVAVLDDGFQHWRLARDLDVVLIDATRPGLDEPLLPAGPRREARSALRRADVVVVTRARAVDPALSAAIEAAHGRPPIAWCDHAWSAIEVHLSAKAPRESPEWLAGRRVGVVAGLGHPDAFMAQVAAAAGAAQWLHRARDHAAYDAPTVARIRAEARTLGLDAIVTTLKDWVKLEPLVRGAPDAATGTSSEPPFAIPIVEIRCIEGETALRALLRSVRGSSRGPRRASG